MPFHEIVKWASTDTPEMQSSFNGDTVNSSLTSLIMNPWHFKIFPWQFCEDRLKNGEIQLCYFVYSKISFTKLWNIASIPEINKMALLQFTAKVWFSFVNFFCFYLLKDMRFQILNFFSFEDFLECIDTYLTQLTQFQDSNIIWLVN